MIRTKEITSEQAQRVHDCIELQKINKDIMRLSSEYSIIEKELFGTWKKDEYISISDIRDGGDKAKLHYNLEQKARELINKKDDIFAKRRQLQKEAQALFASCIV